MKVFEFVPEGIQDCKVTAWLHAEGQSPEMAARKLPVMIVCPGGGYEMVSDREAEPVALPYFAAGYHTFVLRYSVGEDAKNFKPLCQLAATIAHIRKFADEWMIDENKIAVCGFSAGGHLAASSGTLIFTDEFKTVFHRDENIRPDALVLGYPVISSDMPTHGGSILNVSGEPEGSEGYKWFGIDRHVCQDTPPVFMWHTANDSVVSVQNSLKMASALDCMKIPFELHVLPEGPHGMSVCNQAVGSKCDYNARWVDWSIEWLNKLFNFEG